MQQHDILVANIWRVDSGSGIKGQNLTFSEYSHVAYQIKGYDASSILVANILPEDVPDLVGGIKR